MYPNQQVVVPTKKGMTLTKEQLQTLQNDIDSFFSVMREQALKEGQESKASDNVVVLDGGPDAYQFFPPSPSSPVPVTSSCP